MSPVTREHSLLTVFLQALLAAFAGAQGAPPAFGIQEINPEVADDGGDEARMPDFGEEPPVEGRGASSTHAPVKGDDGT